MKSNSERIDIIVDSENADDYLERIIKLDEENFPENAWGFDTWKGLFEGYELEVYLTFFKDRPIGFVATTLIMPEAELLRIGVKPGLRRRSVGTLLIERMLGDLPLKGIETVFLEVRQDNLAALKFYLAIGFKQIGRRRNYYHSPTCDAFIFSYHTMPLT